MAIANEGGGKLVLGVTDQLPRKVVGTSAFRNPVEMAEKLLQVINFRVDIEEVNHQNGRILVFHIPSRPRGTAYHRNGVYLMRIGQALKPMSEDQLRLIFSEGGPHWLEESTKAGLDSKSVVNFLDTQAYFDLLTLPYPTNQAGVLERLQSDRLIDRLDAGFSIRRMGALLLAKHIDDFPDLAPKAARVVVYAGKSKLDTRLDHTESRGYAVGFQNLINFVMSQIAQNEVLESAIRKEMKLVPAIVIRELIANALIHQDFTLSGTSMMVEIYEDRVEITNPGVPMVPVERFIDSHESRNEGLVRVMRRLGICEEKSSGIDRVISEVEASQLPAPDFFTGYHSTVVKIHGYKDFKLMDRRTRIRACYQHCALKWVTSQQMTNLSLRKRFGLHQKKSAVVSQIISATVEAKMIKLDTEGGASRRFARYVPFWA